jgi:hypothetical protein
LFSKKLKGGDYSYGKEESQKESREESSEEESRKEKEITSDFLEVWMCDSKGRFSRHGKTFLFYFSPHPSFVPVSWNKGGRLQSVMPAGISKTKTDPFPTWHCTVTSPLSAGPIAA